MARITRFVSLIFAYIGFGIAAPILALGRLTCDVLAPIAPALFGHASAELETFAAKLRSALLRTDPGDQARHDSFVKRNLAHDLFAGDRFAPELCARC